MRKKFIVTLLIAAGIITSALGQSLVNTGAIYVSDNTLYIDGDYINESSGNIIFNSSNSPILTLTGDLTNNDAADSIFTFEGSNGEVIFDGSSTIGGSSTKGFLFEDLTVNGGATAELSATNNANTKGALSMTGTFTVLSTASSTGSLIIEGSSSGSISMERYVTGSRFHILSPPVSNQPINTFITSNGIDQNDANTLYAFTVYDEANDRWDRAFEPVSGPSSSNMIYGKAYLAGVLTSKALSFTGTPNKGALDYVVGNSGQGWNGVGNPYTSALNVATLISTNTALLDDSYESIYIYNGTNYAYLTTGYVQPGQGFFVKTSSGFFSYTTSMQAHNHPTFYKKSAELEEYAEIKLLATTGDFTDEAVVRLDPEMSYGLDPGKDIGKFMGGDIDFHLYSQLLNDNGVNFALQALPLDSIEKISIPIGLSSKDGGNITFHCEISDLPAGARVILEDRLMNEFVDLEASSASYTVDLTEETSGYGRFYLHTFDPQALGNGLYEIENFNVFAVHKDVHIRGVIEHSGHASVYDLTGRQVRSVKLEAGNLNIINLEDLEQGLYIITVLDKGRSILSEKVLLK